MTAAWWRFGRWVAGVVILAVVVASLNPAAVADRLARAEPALVLVGVVGLVAIHVVPAAGWRAILDVTAGVQLPWRSALGIYYGAQAIGGVTPANVGGDVHRALALWRAGHGWAVAVGPVIVQRATSYLALSALSLLGLTLLATRGALAGPIVAGGLAFAALVAVVAWLLLAPPRSFSAGRAWLARRLGAARPPSSVERIERLGIAAAIGIAQGFAFHAGAIGLTWLLVLAVDPGLAAASPGPTTPAILAALAVARLSMAVPISPSGLGVQEGVAAALFAAIGLAPESALAAMLCARVALLLTTLIGVGLILRPQPASLARRGAQAPRSS